MDNYSMLRIVDCDQHVLQELSEHFTFEVPGAKYMPAVKNKVWDGKIRMINRLTGEVNLGLYWAIKKFCVERNYEIDVEDSAYGYPYDRNVVNHVQTMEWINTLNLPFKVRDYQYDAFTHAVTHKRCVLVSPTGSGKSLIIYLLMRWYLENDDKRILVIVPTTSLVEQMYSDFESYGYNVEENCHKIYS